MCWGYFCSMEASLGRGSFNNTVVWKSVLKKPRSNYAFLKIFKVNLKMDSFYYVQPEISFTCSLYSWCFLKFRSKSPKSTWLFRFCWIWITFFLYFGYSVSNLNCSYSWGEIINNELTLRSTEMNIYFNTWLAYVFRKLSW